MIYNDNLPEPIFFALSNDKYDSGESDYTPSSLNNPAYQTRLIIDNRKNIKEPASSRIWALLGTSVHHMVELGGEKAAHYECERRYYGAINTEWGAKQIGAQVDILDKAKNSIEDMKVTSVYAYGKEPKVDWVQQMNVQRWCVWKETGRLVDSLNIVAIWRDWSKNRMSPNYPPSQCTSIPIPIWTLDETEAWMIQRVSELENAKARTDISMVTPCTESEMWAKPNKYAVKKVGGSRALRVYDTRSEAIQNVKEGQIIETRHGDRTRCESYCSVSEFCPVFKQFKNK